VPNEPWCVLFLIANELRCGLFRPILAGTDANGETAGPAMMTGAHAPR
jgi:hypothetical protein